MSNTESAVPDAENNSSSEPPLARADVAELVQQVQQYQEQIRTLRQRLDEPAAITAADEELINQLLTSPDHAPAASTAAEQDGPPVE